MTTDTWNQVAKTYEASYETQYKRADKLEKQLIAKMLGQFPDTKTILEVGCGTAHFTKWMQTQGYDCYGLDVSGGMLREARILWKDGNLLNGEGSRLPFQNKAIDIVTFMTSLEFMPDAEEALVEAARVAKKGLILGLLNKNSPTTLRRRLRRKPDSPYSYANYYSVADIKKALAALSEKHEVAFLSTTVFPKLLGDYESNAFPFGDFLGLAVKFR